MILVKGVPSKTVEPEKEFGFDGSLPSVVHFPPGDVSGCAKRHADEALKTVAPVPGNVGWELPICRRRDNKHGRSSPAGT
jgi:hypothetical protein